MEDYSSLILAHYNNNWHTKPIIRKPEGSIAEQLPKDFCILEFAPRENREMWTYATCCMSEAADEKAIELHLFAYKQSDRNLALLTNIAYYHRCMSKLDLQQVVNFGGPWELGSLCNSGLISLPYTDGPKLETMEIAASGKQTKFYWLIPITQSEADFAIEYGMIALEDKFEDTFFDFPDPGRESVVE